MGGRHGSARRPSIIPQITTPNLPLILDPVEHIHMQTTISEMRQTRVEREARVARRQQRACSLTAQQGRLLARVTPLDPCPHAHTKYPVRRPSSPELGGATHLGRQQRLIARCRSQRVSRDPSPDLGGTTISRPRCPSGSTKPASAGSGRARPSGRAYAATRGASCGSACEPHPWTSTCSFECEKIVIVRVGWRGATVPPEAPGRPRLRSGARGPWGCCDHLRADAVFNQLHRASSCMLDTCTGTGMCLAAARLVKDRAWLRFGFTPKAGGKAGGGGSVVVLDRRRGQLAETRAARGAGKGVCAPP